MFWNIGNVASDVSLIVSVQNVKSIEDRNINHIVRNVMFSLKWKWWCEELVKEEYASSCEKSF